MAELSPAIIRGRISHARTLPVASRFAYAADYVLLTEAALGGRGGPRLFSYGRRNLVSLHPADHGVGAPGGSAWARDVAADRGVEGVARVALLAHPRVWGYVFNPVSFWLMTDAWGDLRAVLAEVHNTYGDRHAYLCCHPDGRAIGPEDWVEAEKQLHVSPFFDVEGRYRFRFSFEGPHIGVWIRYDDGRGGGLRTSLVGQRRPFTDAEMLRTLARRPLGAARTIALIHWQALRLWRKGLRFRRRPAPPAEPLT